MFKTTPYVIALYIRLSIEDSKVESLSIENQKIALHKYADAMEDVPNAEVTEFIDNGHSGTNFERPAVQELLDAVRAGKVNCIIVKDFSRFGRNSIEVGYFMERVFPLYNVRFISVNDGYDSSDYQGDTGGMNVAFKYLAAEFYSRDLSIKSTTAKMVKMKRGEYQSKICMYGYKKGADGRMEPDEETAPNVRLIFALASQGKSTREISQILRERGVCTPGEYKAARGIAQHDVSRSAGTWQSDTLMRVLRDERYTGTYIIGKRHVTEVGSSHNRLRDESDWIKIPDHHPALVSREIYDEVQEKIKRRPSVKRNTTAYPLRQKVYCGCCRHAMPRSGSKNYLFYCRFTKSNADAACHDLSIRESELEDALYAVLSKQAQVILNVHDLSDAGVLKSCLAEQTDYGNKVEGLKARKAALYEQLVLGKISQEEYRERKAKIDKELMRVEQVYDALSTQSSQMQMDADTKKASRKLAQEITDANGLTAALVDTLIERVYVYPGNRLDIEWKSNDFCREG